MWKVINSPIVITVIVIVSLFVFKMSMKPKLAGEIKAAYNELNAIMQESASDAQKNKAVKKFAEEMATQVREGFAAGLPPADNKNAEYIATKQKVVVSDIKSIASWPNQEKFIFSVKNNSDKSINNLKLNYEYYKQGELIDCENHWVSDFRILEPGQKIALSQDRRLPKEQGENFKADEIKITISSFEIVK